RRRHRLRSAQPRDDRHVAPGNHADHRRHRQRSGERQHQHHAEHRARQPPRPAAQADARTTGRRLMRLPGIAERPRLAPIPLLGMAAAAAIRGTGYVGTNNPPTQLDIIDTLAPFWMYSLVWFGAAALAATAAVTERAFSAAIA